MDHSTFTLAPLKSLIILSLLTIAACGGGGGGNGNGDSASSDANLSDLTVSVAALDQAFDADTTQYTSNATNGQTTTTVTATTSDSSASLTVNGVAATSATASTAIDLQVGDNTLEIIVTAEDGTTQKTYTVNVARASAFANRTALFTHFIADIDSDEVFELYAALDDGSGAVIKLSGAMATDGDVFDFALSPDGSFVAYRADQDVQGVDELFVVPVDTNSSSYKVSDAYRVSAAGLGTGDVKAYAWSPDSTRLIFLADQDQAGADELYMVDADGQNRHKINGGIGGSVEIGDFAWSTDSRYVAYKVYNRDAPDEVIGINSHDSNVTSGPGFSVRLNPGLTGGRSIKSFAWRPGTDQVIYRADQDVSGQNEVYQATASVSQTSVRISQALSAGENITNFALPAIGTAVAYLIDGSSGTDLGANGIAILSNGLDVQSFEWSPDGNSLAFLADTGSSHELFLSSENGSRIAVPMNSAMSSTSSSDGSVMQYAWSADSSRLAYIADQETPDVYELFTSLADASSIGQRVSSAMSNGDVLQFAWSPDSSQLAYLADDENTGVAELYSSAIDGSYTASKLSGAILGGAAVVGAFDFSWGADSGAVVYRATETTPRVTELYSSLADGGNKGVRLMGSLPASANLLNEGDVNDLFRDGSWLIPHHSVELCAIAYDPGADMMYITRCVNSRRNNQVLRYAFHNNTLRRVHEYDSQLDYGMRFHDGELWITRTYGNAVLRLGDLDEPGLTQVADYFAGQFNPDLDEIFDLAVGENDAYFITGEFLTSDNHEGIQKIAAPDFNSISELVSEASADWINNSQDRSIIAIGSGSNAQLVVSGGFGNLLEAWDLNGGFIGHGQNTTGNYLQKDTQDRIYAASIIGTSPPAAQITLQRFPPDIFTPPSIFATFDSQLGSTAGRLRFIIREIGVDQQELVVTRFRNRDPRFESHSIPN